MADCLIVGFKDVDFASHEARVRQMGTESGAYQDLSLSFVRVNGHPLRALDTINWFRPGQHLHNADFMWPVVLVLGTSLHRRGHSFDFVNLPHLEEDRFAEKLAAPDLKAVALTSTLYTEPRPLIELIRFVRAHRPDVPIVVGGPYIAGQAKSLSAEAFEEQLRYLGADIYVISSEGEGALGNVVSALKSGAPLEAIENVVFQRGDGITSTPRRTEYNVLADSMVDYTLFQPSDFGQFVTTRTAKSCPFRCSFCGFPERAGDYTYLSVENVEKELDAIAAIGGVTTLTIIDDTFNVPRKRFKDLLRMMIRNDYGFRWNSFFRCDHSDEETIDLMAQAGCEGVILGVESGSDHILKLMNKTARRAHLLAAIPRLEASGIACYASLIVGFPGETEDTIEETMELIETTRPSYYRAQLWYCDPITAIYKERDEHDIRGDGFNWSHRTMDVHEAGAHIDRMFLSIENSIWQPQAGFEFWSTFYLQRKGMSRGGVDAFLRSFNAGVKEKILRPVGAASLSPARARDLQTLSQFPVPPAPTVCEAPPLSGADFRAAARYWRQAMRGLDDDPQITRAPSEPLFTSAAVGSGNASPDELVALVAALVSGVRGGHHVLLLAPDGAEDELLPFDVRVTSGTGLGELVEQVASLRKECRRHRAYGLPILRRPQFALVPAPPASFDAAVVERHDAWEATVAEHPSIEDEVALLLLRGEDRELRLRTRLGASVTARLAAVSRGMLWDRPGATFVELALATAEPTFDFAVTDAAGLGGIL